MVNVGVPIFGALAYTGFFLNLFNLAPIGFLDGGRIVTALSPWLWLVGFVIMGALTVLRPNFLLVLILVLSVPRLFFLFRILLGRQHVVLDRLALALPERLRPVLLRSSVLRPDVLQPVLRA